MNFNLMDGYLSFWHAFVEYITILVMHNRLKESSRIIPTEFIQIQPIFQKNRECLNSMLYAILNKAFLHNVVFK